MNYRRGASQVSQENAEPAKFLKNRKLRPKFYLLVSYRWFHIGGIPLYSTKLDAKENVSKPLPPQLKVILSIFRVTLQAITAIFITAEMINAIYLFWKKA